MLTYVNSLYYICIMHQLKSQKDMVNVITIPLSDSSTSFPRTCQQAGRGQDAAYIRGMAKLHHQTIGTQQKPSSLKRPPPFDSPLSMPVSLTFIPLLLTSFHKHVATSS